VGRKKHDVEDQTARKKEKVHPLLKDPRRNDKFPSGGNPRERIPSTNGSHPWKTLVGSTKQDLASVREKRTPYFHKRFLEGGTNDPIPKGGTLPFPREGGPF